MRFANKLGKLGLWLDLLQRVSVCKKEKEKVKCHQLNGQSATSKLEFNRMETKELFWFEIVNSQLLSVY